MAPVSGRIAVEASAKDQRRLYDDLAWTWPIISPPEEYVGESENFARVISQHASIGERSLLHLGCGGGHNDHTLKLHFNVTGVDVSTPMLDLARRLNPEVMYHEGDMRSVRLDRQFDAVAILDSVNYMLTQDDLRDAFQTAYGHLRPGGVLLTFVEQTMQGFKQNRTRIMTRKKGDIEIAFIENYYDPDPSDSTYESTLTYLIRERGELKIETDRHLCGIFTLNLWYDNLRSVGFDVKQMSFDDETEGGESVPLLVCVKRV
ncbi:MAG: class I SAM-dependent methyltransferase [Candidatus Eisenbacteria bacterium]